MKNLPQFPLVLVIVFIPLLRPIFEIAKNESWLDLAVLNPLFIWVIGAMLGYLVLQIDQLLDIFIVNPSSNLAQTVKKYFSQSHIQYGMRLLEANKQLQPKLSFRSATFQLVWVALAFFTFTSTSSSFGKGFVLGLGSRLLIEQWNYYLANTDLLKQWLFWQIRREINTQELKWYLVAMTITTLILTGTVRI